MIKADYDSRYTKLINKLSREAILSKYDETDVENIENKNASMKLNDFITYVESTGNPIAKWVLMQQMHRNYYSYKTRAINRLLTDTGETTDNVIIDVHMSSEAFSDDNTENNAVMNNNLDSVLPSYTGMFALSADIICPKELLGRGHEKANARLAMLNAFMVKLKNIKMLDCFDRLTIGSLEAIRKHDDSNQFAYIDMATMHN